MAVGAPKETLYGMSSGDADCREAVEKYVGTAVRGDTPKHCLLSIAPPRQTAVLGSRTDGRLLATQREGAGGRTLHQNGMSGGGEWRRRDMPPGHPSWTMIRTPPASPIREAATCDHQKRGGEGGGWGRRMPASHPSEAVQTAPAWASPGKKWACRQWACTLATPMGVLNASRPRVRSTARRGIGVDRALRVQTARARRGWRRRGGVRPRPSPTLAVGLRLPQTRSSRVPSDERRTRVGYPPS